MARITVSNASQLNSAIKSAGNGDIIVLKSGNYGSISLNSVNKNVTLTSENGGNPATLSSLTLNKSSNIDVEGLKFTGSGTGVTVRSSKNIDIEDSTFIGNKKGIAVNNSNSVNIRDNDFTKMNNDGIALSGVNGAQITGNQIRDMKTSGSQHHDGIQIHPTNGASSNIVIRGNVIDTNDTNTQAIYMGGGTTHRNIDIENNTITAGHKYGIKIAAKVAGLDIKNNVVIQDPALKSNKGGHTPEIDISKASTGVSITGNTAHDISASGNVSNNKIVSIGTNATASGSWSNSNSSSDSSSSSSSNSSSSSSSNNGSTITVDGDTVKGWTKKVIKNFDFDDGDALRFQDYDNGTLKPGANGQSATIDSAAELRQMINSSSDVTSKKSGNALVVVIDQDDGTHAVRLPNIDDIEYFL